MPNRKRRLTKTEVDEVREWFESAPQDRKPTIKQIARRYGVNKPSVIKSLGGWKGIKRGRPEPPAKFKPEVISLAKEPPVKIQGYTQEFK